MYVCVVYLGGKCEKRRQAGARLVTVSAAQSGLQARVTVIINVQAGLCLSDGGGLQPPEYAGRQLEDQLNAAAWTQRLLLVHARGLKARPAPCRGLGLESRGWKLKAKRPRGRNNG